MREHKTKQIRPLIAFKKENPMLYTLIMKQLVSRFSGSRSTKQQENDFHFWYCFFESKINANVKGLELEERTKTREWQFFFKDPDTESNKSTVSEMGRLLLTGWYYGSEAEDFTQEVCQQIFSAWKFKLDNNQPFNDMEFGEAVKHIRENIGFYYYHRNELKIYMLKHFFMEQIKPMLPEMPEELKDFYAALDMLDRIKKANLKRNPDYYYQQYHHQENYISYLEELLDQYGIGYESFDEYIEKEERETEKYFQEIERLEQEYQRAHLSALVEGAVKLSLP